MTETIPTNIDKFKQWADRACVDWPGDLQAKAYTAWIRWNAKDGSFEKFVDAYSAFRRGK